MSGEFSIDYVELPNGRTPAREFIDAQDNAAAAKIDAAIERLGEYGNRMPPKMVDKLADDLFELRVKHFDRIFRILFFYQPGRLIVLTSGFQKKTRRAPPGEVHRAEKLRRIWLRYHNDYPKAQEEQEAILREAGL
jgi:phage-related protein